MPELTQAIPVIATDDPPTRHRRPCCDLDTPPRARAVGVEAYRRQLEADARMAGAAALHPKVPHLDEAVLAVAELLTGDGAARLHQAREIVTVVTMLAERRELDRRIAAVAQAVDDRELVTRTLITAGVERGAAAWCARTAVDALADAGRL